MLKPFILTPNVNLETTTKKWLTRLNSHVSILNERDRLRTLTLWHWIAHYHQTTESLDPIVVLDKEQAVEVAKTCLSFYQAVDDVTMDQNSYHRSY